ncbi:MAG: prepilin-type N-terminal cleavage/methylation domain-containing protein [Verrucomicrobiales bacterium]|jgi:prepilin-type N-terminal cleavage/methylation domain-containing protein
MKSTFPIQRRNAAFSLVEILAATVLLGILAFIAIPNIVKMRDDAEVKLAIVRAEAINMSIGSYFAAQGRSSAATAWTTAASGDTEGAARYALIKPYMAFAPNAFTDYMPGSYTITLPTDITTLSKVALADPGGTAISY